MGFFFKMKRPLPTLAHLPKLPTLFFLRQLVPFVVTFSTHIASHHCLFPTERGYSNDRNIPGNLEQLREKEYIHEAKKISISRPLKQTVNHSTCPINAITIHVQTYTYIFVNTTIFSYIRILICYHFTSPVCLFLCVVALLLLF